VPAALDAVEEFKREVRAKHAKEVRESATQSAADGMHAGTGTATGTGAGSPDAVAVDAQKKPQKVVIPKAVRREARRNREAYLEDMMTHGYLLPYWVPLLSRFMCPRMGSSEYAGDAERERSQYQPFRDDCFHSRNKSKFSCIHAFMHSCKYNWFEVLLMQVDRAGRCDVYGSIVNDDFPSEFRSFITYTDYRHEAWP
jgi:hypothetical protein